MFIGFFKLTATVSPTVLISVFVKGQNPNVYKWPEAESNCRPLVFQTSALPTELSGRMAGTTGFEPATSCVTGRRELQTSPRPRNKMSITKKNYNGKRIIRIICK